MVEPSQVGDSALFDSFSLPVAFDNTEVGAGTSLFDSDEHAITNIRDILFICQVII